MEMGSSLPHLLILLTPWMEDQCIITIDELSQPPPPPTPTRPACKTSLLCSFKACEVRFSLHPGWNTNTLGQCAPQPHPTPPPLDLPVKQVFLLQSMHVRLDPPYIQDGIPVH